MSYAKGQVIDGRFRLEGPLGEGGMGEVWRATQLNLERELAIKLLLPEHAAKAGARARFEREARVASQLKHPHAVQIYDFGEDQGHLYIAMEVLRGHTLRAIVDVHLPPPPVERTARILAQVADAVLAAHEIGLVHRDLKPENVFLERALGGDRAVVVDFGLAFIADRPSTGRMTREGIATGTPEYMSPEQAAGDEVGPPTDVYALGVMLYEMLTSEPPFTGGAMQIITQQLFSAPTPPRERKRDLMIPRELEELCMRMLEKSADARPAMDVVLGLLSQFRDDPHPEERGRGRKYLQDRQARMISAVHAPTLAATTPDAYAQKDATSLQLAVVGQLHGELALGLAANGLVPFIVSEEQPLDGADAIFAPGASGETLEELIERGIPVLTDTPAGDMARVTDLLRVGVDDVLERPARVEELAKKVWRAVRRHRRRTGDDR